MIWHLYIACDRYRFGTRALRLRSLKSRRPVALPPRAPKSVDPRISLPLDVEALAVSLRRPDGILT